MPSEDGMMYNDSVGQGTPLPILNHSPESEQIIVDMVVDMKESEVARYVKEDIQIPCSVMCHLRRD